MDRTSSFYKDYPNAEKGWSQLGASRYEMLNAFDEAKARAAAHEVKTWHGNVAEAKFREWLTQFLPKKFGVTSGYILSEDKFALDYKFSHYDVIIYDQTECPVVWVDDNPDYSELGKSRAVIAPYVKAVLEVKSRLTAQSAKKSIEHLLKLEPFLREDQHEAKITKYLPKEFFSMVFFYEMHKKDNRKQTLTNLIPGRYLRGFSGGFILRGEVKHKDESATISAPLRADQKINDPDLSNRLPMDNQYAMGISNGKKDNNEFYLYMATRWGIDEFSRFAFDLLARLNGCYDLHRLSSSIGLRDLLAILPPSSSSCPNRKE